MKDINSQSLDLHHLHKGKLEIGSKIPILTKEDLSLLYTPGVGAVSAYISEDSTRARDYTWKGRVVAVVSDGSAVLGLGNIGPEAALPVMEGKCVLFKEFGGIDAVPLCINTQNTDEIVRFVELIAPSFGGINLEDISAPRCFEIEERLQKLGIPVFHDDQHGTAIVVLAGLLNAARLLKKDLTSMRIVINGAGAAGTAITKLLLGRNPEERLVKNVCVCDSKGIVSLSRSDLTDEKIKLAEYTQCTIEGLLSDALRDADVFIGVSAGGVLNPQWISYMNDKPIIFALANPIPEIFPEEALSAGGAVVASGRSDFPNQINNVLVFPGIFKGVLKSGASSITFEMKRQAAYALASLVKEPTSDYIIPSPFEPHVADVIAEAIEEIINTKK